MASVLFDIAEEPEFELELREFQTAVPLGHPRVAAQQQSRTNDSLTPSCLGKEPMVRVRPLFLRFSLNLKKMVPMEAYDGGGQRPPSRDDILNCTHLSASTAWNVIPGELSFSKLLIFSSLEEGHNDTKYPEQTGRFWDKIVSGTHANATE